METACCTCGMGWSSTEYPSTDMRALWRGLAGTIFWSYDRGSWPYDVVVILIVLFVLATPRHWFHDQPRSDALASTSVQVISEDPGSHIQTYRLDAKLLAPEKRSARSTPELERETHDILGRTVEGLKDHTFQVVRIDPIQSSDGSVQYYDVMIHP
jgi:hypothetical protein